MEGAWTLIRVCVEAKTQQWTPGSKSFNLCKVQCLVLQNRLHKLRVAVQVPTKSTSQTKEEEASHPVARHFSGGAWVSFDVQPAAFAAPGAADLNGLTPEWPCGLCGKTKNAF